MEGLLKQGAIKVDDRPLWFDVYKAFPPITEPKYARPSPENKTIRPILYKEDIIRAKFHAQGHGISSHMLTSSGETQTKRLIQKYKTLNSEGIPEEEIIEKCASAVSSERQDIERDYVKTGTNKPESVTAQVLGDVNLKNIFKDK